MRVIHGFRPTSLLGAALLLLAACAPAAPPAAPPPAPATAPPQPPQAPAAAQPQTPAPAQAQPPAPTAAAAGKTFIYAVPGVSNAVDPAFFEGDPGRWTTFEQLSSLVAYDASALKGSGCDQLATIKDLRGELAESWKLKDDRSGYVVKLRQAKSPYGNTLTTQDVVWSFQRHTTLSGVSRNMYFVQAQYQENPIAVIDERTFELRVKQPTSLDMALHTIGPFTMGIYDSTEAKKHVTADDPWAAKWLNTHTANYGPWQVQSFQPGQEVVYVPNPNYWGKRGNVDKLIIRAIPESSTRMQLLQAGEVDWAARLSFDEYVRLQSASGVTVRQCLSPNRDAIMLQLNDKRFADARVRKAFSLGIDREALVKAAQRGFGTPSASSLPAGYNAPTSGEKIGYDPQRAKALLAEAGYPDGFSATFTISPARPGPHAEQTAILVRDQLAQIGVKLQIEVVASASDFNTRFQKGQYEAMLYLDPPAVADPAYTLANYNKTKAAQNTHNYSNPEYDRLLTEIAALEPGAERDKRLQAIDRIIVDDTPMVYLVDRTYINAFRSTVSGYQAAPHGELLAVNLTKQ